MPIVEKSHQRLIREGEGQPDATAMLEDATIRQISKAEATKVILRYEWLGTMPGFESAYWGLFFGGTLGGALVFSGKPGANLASNSNSIVPHDALYLARGACAHWTPANSASFFISGAARQMGNVTILAYADESAGEIGQIYRALNWYYLGRSAGGPSAWTVDGKLWGTRSIQSKFGTRSADALLLAFPGAIIKPVKRKHRFLGVYGTPTYRRTMRARLAPHVAEYQLHRQEEQVVA